MDPPGFKEQNFKARWPPTCAYGSEEAQVGGAQRVQVPKISGLWSQKPFRVWFLEPESLNIGYLDPLGGSSKGSYGISADSV